VVQKLADSYSVQSVVVGGFHMAAIASFTAETAERHVVEDDDEEEDVYGSVSPFSLILMLTLTAATDTVERKVWSRSTRREVNLSLLGDGENADNLVMGISQTLMSLT
jgi:hypothetical protein